MFIIRIQWCFYVIMLFAFQVTAQVEYINGQKYEKLENTWYATSDTKSGKDLVDTEVITVKFYQGTSESAIDNLTESLNTTVLRINKLDYYDIMISSEDDPIEKVQSFQNSTIVEFAQPNTFGEFFGDPNDPLFSNQWFYKNNNDYDIDADEAWSVVTGAPQVLIALLDDGIDLDHPDLVNNIWINPIEANGIAGVDDDGNGRIDDFNGWSFSPDNPGNDVDDGFPHGTFIAGIVGAKSNNNEGVAGIAGGWGAAGGAKILPVVVRSIIGSGVSFSIVDDAIDYAVELAEIHNMKLVINMSFGRDFSLTVVQAAIDRAHAKGAFLVAATGNHDEDDIRFPASGTNVFAVGASDQLDTRQESTDPYLCSSSPWGSNYGSGLHIVAPGTNIISTEVNAVYGCAGGIVGEGTSFSAPMAAATAALCWNQKPTYTNDDIKKVLITSAEKVGGYNYDQTLTFGNWNNEMGYGRLNTYYAVAPPSAPVGLTATAGGLYQPVELSWSPNSEPDLNKYKIFRAYAYNGNMPDPESYEKIATINAFDNGNQVTSYIDIESFHYPSSMYLYYKIKAQDTGYNDSPFSNIASYNAVLKPGSKSQSEIKEFAVLQNYPNPFNPMTVFTIELPDRADVEIVIFDLHGRKVIKLINQEFQAGRHEINWFGKGEQGISISAGLYFFQVNIQNELHIFSETRKMILLK